MKLWLDDERNPSDPFIQERFGAEGDEIWVKTAQEAIQMLQGGGITYISFDHDLGDGMGTGYDVARWIEEQAFKGNIPPIDYNVHSQNGIGRKNIIRSMKQAERFWG